MVIGNLNAVGIFVLPVKTNPPLIVYPNAVLALTTTLQLLQPIARQYPEIADGSCRINHSQFSIGDALQLARKAFGSQPQEYTFRVFVGERFYHCNNNNAVRYCCQTLLWALADRTCNVLKLLFFPGTWYSPLQLLLESGR